VQLPKNIAIKKLKVIIKEGDSPKIQDIEKGVGSTNNLRDKVIILFIASSGMITGDLRRLKISDFLEATKDYHNSNNIKELLNNMGC
jgi:hypothetical protein